MKIFSLRKAINQHKVRRFSRSFSIQEQHGVDYRRVINGRSTNSYYEDIKNEKAIHKFITRLFVMDTIYGNYLRLWVRTD